VVVREVASDATVTHREKIHQQRTLRNQQRSRRPKTEPRKSLKA
jgi:hypothetical protein